MQCGYWTDEWTISKPVVTRYIVMKHKYLKIKWPISFYFTSSSAQSCVSIAFGVKGGGGSRVEAYYGMIANTIKPSEAIMGAI